MPQKPKSHGTETTPQIFDLRSALEYLDTRPGDLMHLTEPVDPHNELAGLYRIISTGRHQVPPAPYGPAMLFQKVKGYKNVRITAGLLGTRERTAHLLGTRSEKLAGTLLEALEKPLATVTGSSTHAPCQEIVHTAPLDVRRLLPAPTNTPLDAGPYFTMGLIRAEDPETGQSDVTIHRMCIQGPDLLSVYFVPGRHIDHFRIKAEKMNRPLPISINIGLDPAVYLAACFEEPATPLGFDELSIAGALRGHPVELAPCVSVEAMAIAHAEIVIEGEILPGQRIIEDGHTNTGFSMPEFLGYMGKAQPELPVIKIKAITHRRDPILQTIFGPSDEFSNLMGIPTEAGILRLLDRSLPGRVLNLYSHPGGGGKCLLILQFKKTSPADEGRQRQAALTAFAAFSELKQVILVDDDVNPFDSDDILWALTTRFQGDHSTVFLPGFRCHPLDPSQSPEFSPFIASEGISCKTIFDCTVPYRLRERFMRVPFEDVDVKRFVGEP